VPSTPRTRAQITRSSPRNSGFAPRRYPACPASHLEQALCEFVRRAQGDGSRRPGILGVRTRTGNDRLVVSARVAAHHQRRPRRAPEPQRPLLAAPGPPNPAETPAPPPPSRGSNPDRAATAATDATHGGAGGQARPPATRTAARSPAIAAAADDRTPAMPPAVAPTGAGDPPSSNGMRRFVAATYRRHHPQSPTADLEGRDGGPRSTARLCSGYPAAATPSRAPEPSRAGPGRASRADRSGLRNRVRTRPGTRGAKQEDDEPRGAASRTS
jgi:hypothetical protein